MKLAKAGASSVFNDPTIFNGQSEYRVGYTTIWAGGNGNPDQTFEIPVANNNGLFTGANRTTWFERLFASSSRNGTPLRRALERSGQYFSRTDANGPWGPQEDGQQFQCRQNFTILTTDGIWNVGTPTVSYGNSDQTADTVAEQKTRPDGPPYLYPAGRPFEDGWSETLADIAMHYWKTDLRPEAYMQNIVPVSASNPAFWQHMVTFGISIGLKGTLDPKTDLPNLTSGGKDWPNPMDAEDLHRIDDLFHASVNGRGSFVAAANPAEFADGLGSALRSISERRGSGSNVSVTSASTSNSTNVFAALFFSSKWYGELKSFGITPTGINGVADWTATIPATGRSIFTHNGTGGASFPTAAQTAALGADVAAYIAGDRTQEQPAGPYRARVSLLGDIVNSSPTYLKTSATSETVFVGANDGMLHAFDAASGIERFAYVPRGLEASKLIEYSNPTYSHRFYVDGPVIVSSTRVIANRRILVGTLGRGGKGLFALDVTNPGSFSQSDVLWDRTGATGDNNMGNILGAPLIAKLNNGDVGLIVNNGMNSTGEKAVLQIYNLLTGALIEEIDTGRGTVAAPNGLSSPTGLDEDSDGTVDYVYAGDHHGNVWKFDLSGANSNTWDIANNRALYEPTTGIVQPITGGVTLGLDPDTFKRWVFFGTGRFVVQSDLLDTSRQTWYGIQDGFTTTTRRSDLTARDIAKLDATNFNRAFEPHAALPNGSRGWYVDLDTPPSNTLEGERMVGSQQVVGRALIASSIIPSTANPCLPGRGYLNLIDAYTGTSLANSTLDANNNGKFDDDTMDVGGQNVSIGSVDPGAGMLSDFATLDKLIVGQGSSGRTASFGFRGDRGVGRISWREITRN
jgi:type IV pilus assembly protein PilY1